MVLAVTGQQMMGLVREALAAEGLKPRQLRTLALLEDSGPIGQRELGEALGIDHSVLVTLLNPLEAEGLLARERDPQDRRCHVVSISPAGTERLRSAAATLDAVDARLLEHLSEEQREELVRALATVTDVLGPPQDPTPDSDGC